MYGGVGVHYVSGWETHQVSFNAWSCGGGCDTWGQVLHWWIQSELSVTLVNQDGPKGYIRESSYS